MGLKAVLLVKLGDEVSGVALLDGLVAVEGFHVEVDCNDIGASSSDGIVML